MSLNLIPWIKQSQFRMISILVDCQNINSFMHLFLSIILRNLVINNVLNLPLWLVYQITILLYCNPSDIPLAAVTVKSNTTSYVIGANIALTCQAISRPNSQITWTLNGAPITSVSNIRITYSTPSSSITLAQSVLTINGLTQSNNGDYQCIGNYSTGGIIQRSTISISK